jgi:hypothetical protein
MTLEKIGKSFLISAGENIGFINYAVVYSA